MSGQLQGSRIGRWLLHLIGIVALMSPALINGQPFFFSDTTAYVRAADLAVQIASRHHIRTAWSRADPAPTAPAAVPAPAQTASTPSSTENAPVHVSDARNGSVMAGRSPYFGLLLYLGYVSSNFWLFVLAQAITAWWLIGLAQRVFGPASLPLRLGIAAALVLLTPLPVYVGLLLADALAGFGILAFLILARPPRDLARWEMPALVLLLLVSAAAHFTHIVIIASLTGLLGLLALTRTVPWAQARTPILIGVGVTVAGLLSVMATNFAVAKALGKPPAAAPVLTARFIVDGPGRAFVAAGCGGGQHFAACTRPTGTTDTDGWLWDNDPAWGGFAAADPDTRAALSAEDGRFAAAVLRAYPVWQSEMMAWNSFRQATRFDVAILNERCYADPGCSTIDVPDPIRATMQRSPAGHNLFPTYTMAMAHRIATVAGLILIGVAYARLRGDAEGRHLLLLWFGLGLAAFLINDFLGGAISNPQTRYQERIVWIIPLLAMVAMARAMRFRRGPEPARPLP